MLHNRYRDTYREIKMDNLINLNEMEKDALRELGNVGTGNAATALSKLLNKHIEIIIPDTKFIPINRFSEEFGGAETIVVSTYLPIIGDLSGESMFIFPVISAEKIIDMMMSQEVGTSKIMDEMSQSAFKEMSNIFSGAYLSSLADFLQIKILPSVPHITTDMLQSVLDFLLAKMSNHSDNILCIKTHIKIVDIEIEGHFVMFFDIASMNKLLRILKEMYNLT